jgi:type I restriction enzyme S subunit
MRVSHDHNPQWLNFLLNSSRFWAYARSHALMSLHQANLNARRYGRMKIPVPPRTEQDEIVGYITKKSLGIDTAIARTKNEIALMLEYRTRLTADIVTGKVDVRDASANLPDVPAADSSKDQVVAGRELDLEAIESEVIDE